MKGRRFLLLVIIAFLVAHYGTFAWGAEQNAEAVKKDEPQKMLFLCYWELNENMPVLDHLKVGKMLKETGLFPPPGVEIIRFDMTPGYWGSTVFTAESAEAAFALVDLWRIGGAGFFKKIKISPAMPVPEASASGAKLYKVVMEAEAQMKQKEMAAPKK